MYTRICGVKEGLMHRLPSSCCVQPTTGTCKRVLIIPLGIYAYRYIYMYLVVVQAPRSPYDRVYVLPLLTIKTNKGTGLPLITVSLDYFLWCVCASYAACLLLSVLHAACSGIMAEAIPCSGRSHTLSASSYCCQY